jgi:DNA-binding CsgD family transcriptional regulator
MHPLTEESLARFEAIDDDWGRAWALCGVGLAAWMGGNKEAAQSRITESLELNRRLGDRWTSAIPLGYLGRLAFRAHENARAQSHWEQSLALYREAGEIGRAAEMLHALAALARLQGDPDRAATHCRESLGLFRRFGFRQGIAACLSELAALLGASGQPERAARVFGAAAALRDAVAAYFPSSDRIDYDAEIATARAHLGEAVFSAAWSEGRSAPVDDVLADALAALPTGPEASAVPATMSPTAGLSRREVEVMRLLAGGQSNKEIAADLTLSIHTIERHLANIYAKIGARGRADAVAFALRHGIA